MVKNVIKYVLILVTTINLLMCRKAYNPPAIKAGNHFVAVDGFVNTGANSSSSFTISRSRNLSDSITDIPELNANVVIESSNGSSFPLTDNAGNGVYMSDQLNLDNSQNYRLAVTTRDGNRYESDFVTPKIAPPIDSITWELIDDPTTGAQAVRIYVNAHDPTSGTQYYRWDYLETWEHISALESPWLESNGLIYPLNFPENTHICWSTEHSKNILLGSSVALSEDVISHSLLADIPQNSPKMDIKYSILVRQYPLTFDAYNYWLTVQHNSQTLGGLFDLQPSQIIGNIHGITNPNDPVLGYVSASSVQEQRIFISNKSLTGWQSNPAYACTTRSLPTDPLNLLVYNYADTSYAPYHFEGDLIVFLVVAPKSCMYCTYQGGVNVKPSFWQ